MSHKSFKCLLHIKLYELTGDEIGEIKKEEKEGHRFYETILPQYCLHVENGKLKTTRDYLQWIESGEEKYLLFDANTLDDILDEEISNGGIEELLRDIDLRPFFLNFHKLKMKGLTHRSLQSGQYLIISICYIGGDMWNPDWDMEVYVDGVLTSDLNLLVPIV